MLRLTIEREKRSWSRAELARRAMLNAATGGAVAAGRLVAYPSQLQKIARALEIDPDAAHLLLDEVEIEVPDGSARRRHDRPGRAR